MSDSDSDDSDSDDSDITVSSVHTSDLSDFSWDLTDSEDDALPQAGAGQRDPGDDTGDTSSTQSGGETETPQWSRNLHDVLNNPFLQRSGHTIKQH